MSTPAPASLPIVVGVDGQDASRIALDWAVDAATRRRSPLHLVHAAPMPLRGPGADPSLTHHTDAADTVLEAAVARVRSLAPGVVVSTSTSHGSPVPLIVEASKAASLVVTGARGRGAVRSAMLGSTSVDVAAQAHAPVVVVRELPTATADRPRVVVGSDGSELSAAAIEAAFFEADARDLPLTVVHAWVLEYATSGFAVFDSEDARRQIAQEQQALAAESVAGWSEKYPDVVVHQHVLNGHPVEALVQHSRGAELVVVGSRGRGGFAGLLLGSVSQGVLHHAHCPVMVVRPALEGKK